MKMKYFSL